ncbi:MAG TPA: tRNA (adenosine(37)-N6)-threonylcarbamoyltransferase complex dimerization subunit type 1 TsaB [Myxococcota bacterium]
MSWLLLDTALPRAVVAVVAADGTVQSEVLLDETRRHAERLTAAVDDALSVAGIVVGDLVGIGVGIGPGSFIGVRTGLSFARGLGSALQVPVVGVDAITSLYASVVDDGAGAVVVVDARRGERYLGHVDVVGGAPQWRAEPVAVPNADVVATAGDVVHAVGAVDSTADGELQWPTSMRLHPLPGATARGMWRALQAATARQAGHGPAHSPVAPLPVYVRGADAKLPSTDPAARRASVLATLDALDASEPSGGPR